MTSILKVTTILYLLIISIISQGLSLALGFSASEQFVDAFVENTEPFVNEQVTYTFRYYHQNIPPTLEQPKYFPPSFTGFRTQRLPSNDIKPKVINGVTYRVKEIRTVLFPVSSGRHKIEPASFYIPAFNESFDQPKTLKTHSIELNIKPLPERGRPVNFTGAVGKYQIQTEIDKTEVSVGQPLTLNIVLSGTGNIETCPKPDIPEIEDFKRYKPTEKISTFNESSKLKGEIFWEYVLIAQKAGNYTIPSIRYNYFSPDTETYEIARTQPISMVVKSGANESTSQDEAIAKSDSSRFYQNVYLWLVVILFSLAIVAIIVLRSGRKVKNTSDYAQENAAKIAEERLKKIEDSLDSPDSAQFFTELTRTVREYISAKLNISQVELKAESIPSLMTKVGYSEKVSGRLAKILERFDRARFAPVAVNSEEMREAIRSVREIIIFLENAGY